MAFTDKLRDVLRSFNHADSANVLLTFSVAVLPIMGFVGAAVDYSRANSDKAAMQAAVDATALWLSKNAATMTTAQLNQNATSHFNAVFTRTDVTSIVITPTYTTSGDATGRNRSRQRCNEIHGPYRIFVAEHKRDLDHQMGQFAAAGSACAG